MKTATKKQRTYKILSNCSVRITVGKQSTTYRIRFSPLSTAGEFAVEFQKVDSDDQPYHVTLTAAGAACDCMGHLRHGHCKHAALVCKLGGLKS